MLCQKQALKATIYNPSFASLSRNDHVAAAIKDIEDEEFWKARLLSAVFPSTKALWHCDSNIPAMDKIFFIVKAAATVLLDSQKFHEIEDLFGAMRGVILSNCEWMKLLVK